ncbi:MAG: hypothetical protein AABX14_04115 [Candidatus Aenigmatarchaeota archaeon]
MTKYPKDLPLDRIRIRVTTREGSPVYTIDNYPAEIEGSVRFAIDCMSIPGHQRSATSGNVNVWLRKRGGRNERENTMYK